MSDDAGGTASPVARAYDRWADTYDTALNLTRDLDARVLREAPLELPGADVVEIGCGTGKNTAWLAAWARGVTALDFSSEMLARARERVRGEHVRFVRHDAREPWPVGDASADVVTVNLVLEHVADLAPVFAEGLRVLRPGGRFFLCELHPYRQWRGGQAHFVVRGTGETIHVPAHQHTVSEYVNGGVAAGLLLRQMGEWLEEGASPDAPPRLLSLLFVRPDTGTPAG